MSILKGAILQHDCTGFENELTNNLDVNNKTLVSVIMVRTEPWVRNQGP
jgi:hypothetical protein